MDKETIKSILSSVIPLSIQDGFVERKRTVVDTTHVGKLTGNRLNSGTLRSQFIVYEDASDWRDTDVAVKRALHSDQRVFVQKSDDVWDVYKGSCLTAENADPQLILRNVEGLAKLVEGARKEIRVENGGDEDRHHHQQRKSDVPLQLITYGAPGTGKSWKTDKWIRENGIESFRTTFHPDSDYSTFVGAYKPTMKPEQRINCIDDKAKAVKDASGNPSMHDVISYEFRPQAFILAYVAAWKKMAANGERGMGNGAMGASRPTDVGAMNSGAPVCLVIEEINRGNCAQIFGDIFQLLDRDESGWSSYPISADTDLAKYLKDNLPDLSALSCPDKMKPDDWNKVKVGEMLALPPNLYIHATMNTSDQSLFPIDSAFKRRWDWKYIPIAKPTEAVWVDRTIRAAGKKFDWWDFISIINECILDKTKSEDKQLGYFFVKAPDATGVITAEKFANKVLFYIYNDVFKDYDLPKDVFGKESGDDKYAFKDFFAATGYVDEAVVAEFLSHLKKGDKKIAVAEDTAVETPPSAEAPAE